MTYTSTVRRPSAELPLFSRRGPSNVAIRSTNHFGAPLATWAVAAQTNCSNNDGNVALNENEIPVLPLRNKKCVTGDRTSTRNSLGPISVALGTFIVTFAVASNLHYQETTSDVELKNGSAAFGKNRTATEYSDNCYPTASAHKKPSVGSDTALSADIIFSLCSPAVVQVLIEDRNGNTIGRGSGFLVSSDGLFATNYHVVKDADTAYVVFADNSKQTVSGVVALDQEADVAILRVAAKIGIKPLELSVNDVPPIGTKVYAIGNPKGLSHTLSDGLVSGHRKCGDLADFVRIAMIQTTASISHGSSGGPLLGTDGRVIGITTLSRNGQNLNFAVPVSYVARLLLRWGWEGTLTRFPLKRPDGTLKSQTNSDWLPEDVANAAYFMRAIRASNEAWALCRTNRNGDQLYPSMLSFTDNHKFNELIRQANRDARQVRKDVLRRMHANLPVAFDDFIAVTSYLPNHSMDKNPDSAAVAAWGRWIGWWGSNQLQVRTPKLDGS